MLVSKYELVRPNTARKRPCSKFFWNAMKRRAEFGRPEAAYPARIESKDLGPGYLSGLGHPNRMMHRGEQLRLGRFPV